MVFKIDVDGDEIREWHKTADGAAVQRRTDYAPEIYVCAPDGPLSRLESTLADDPKVVATDRVERYRTLHADERSTALRVRLERVDETRTLATEIRRLHERGTYPPGSFELYNVDFSPQFRYCLETGTSPVPDRGLSLFELDVGETALAARDVTELGVDGEVVAGDEAEVVRTVRDAVADADPDVLLLRTAEIVPLLYEKADAHGVDDFDLGRLPGWSRLAGESTFESYGRVGHSPARYDVPGRAILDRSNSFLWSQSNLAGLLYLVERSWKPVQETGWASIGNVLTAIQIREAVARDVLVPWNKWEPEVWKDVRTLHAADRGGFTFEPQVGLHEDVHEVDFSSLYPNIICRENISPDTILCDCHADREDVPGLGYNVCDRRGFLPDVLQPLLSDRAGMKRRLAALDAGADPDDPDEAADLRATSNAIKWILVSCFGYQGYRNSKFGRIECHEAINAVARDILLTAKERFEAGGWEVVHGIVDSLWVRPRGPSPDATLETLVARVTAEVGITLDVEARYDWVCFVPKRGSRSGALTKYFGKKADGGYKYRGIERRQRSTPTYVTEAQGALIEALDRHREPAAVCDVATRFVSELRSGRVDPADLVIRNRVSKPPSEYAQRTKAVEAMRRYGELGVPKAPGQDVRYVVVDDDPDARERVRLYFEDVDGYDPGFYVELLLRATESVVSPLGWDRADIDRYLRRGRDIGLSAFE